MIWCELFSSDGRMKPCSSAQSGGVLASMEDLPHDKVPHAPPLTHGDALQLTFQVHPNDVSMDDFLASLKNHPKTVNLQELAKFETFTASHGQVG